MTRFENLTGIVEESSQQVRQHLVLEEDRLRCRLNDREWNCGTLKIPSLAQLRTRVQQSSFARSAVKVREVVANVQDLLCDVNNAGAMSQVASQFNLLEMAGPDITPEEGVGTYEHDFTEEPACAIAAGAGTIYRNYFLPCNGQIGQTAHNQIDCLADIEDRLGTANQRLWHR